MGHTVIEFDKMLHERLEEYKDIFAVSPDGDEKRDNSQPVLGNHISDIWRNHLSFLLHHNGWKALWRISIRKCHLMNTAPPANVIVKVCSIHWKNFSAEVEVLNIGDADVPSSKKILPLIELLPIEQDFEGDVWIIANELDKYRFFYQHVWFPWDENDCDAAEWVEAHLEERLELLNAIVTGEVRAEDTERIRYLVCAAYKIQEEIEKTETLLQKLKDDLNGEEQNKDGINKNDMENLRLNLRKLDIQAGNEKSKKTEREESLIFHLLELQKHMEMIQQEFKMLENPFTRKVLANEKKRRHKNEMMKNNNISLNIDNNESKNEEISSPEFALIWENGSFNQLKTVLSLIESKIGNETECAVYPSLQQAIDERNEESISLFVCSGFHILKPTGELLYPGTFIEGISQECGGGNAVIFGHSFGEVMMIVDWMSKEISPKDVTEWAVLENLHFDPYDVKAVLLIYEGGIQVKNCCFSHEETNPKLSLFDEFKMPPLSVLQAFSDYEPSHRNMKTAYEDSPSFSMPILPLPGAFDCPPLCGIGVGAAGRLEAFGCNFQELHVGITICSGAKVHLSDCTFSKCQVAIRITIGAEVVVEGCNFLQNKMHSIHIYVPEEHDEEIKDIMGSEIDLFTSSQMLERIPGITFKNCIFVNDTESKDLHLSFVSKEHIPAEKDDCGTCTNQAVEDFKEVANDDDSVFICDDEPVTISDDEPVTDDSIVILN